MSTLKTIFAKGYQQAVDDFRNGVPHGSTMIRSSADAPSDKEYARGYDRAMKDLGHLPPGAINDVNLEPLDDNEEDDEYNLDSSSVTVAVKDVEAVTLSQWQTSQSLMDSAKSMAASYQSLVNAQNKVIDALSTTVENYTREIARYIEEVEEYRRKATRYEEDCSKRLEETRRFGAPRSPAPQIPVAPPVPATLAAAVQNVPEASELAATVDRSTKKVTADAKKTIGAMAAVQGNQLLLELKQGIKLRPVHDRTLLSQPVRPKDYKSPAKLDPLATLKARRAAAAAVASHPIVVASVTSPKKIAAQLALSNAGSDTQSTNTRVGQEIAKGFEHAHALARTVHNDEEEEDEETNDDSSSDEEVDEVAKKSGSEFDEHSQTRSLVKQRNEKQQRRERNAKRYPSDYSDPNDNLRIAAGYNPATPTRFSGSSTSNHAVNWDAV